MSDLSRVQRRGSKVPGTAESQSSTNRVMPTLEVGPAGDRSEREADHVAERVVRALSQSPVLQETMVEVGPDGPKGRVQRMTTRPGSASGEQLAHGGASGESLADPVVNTRIQRAPSGVIQLEREERGMKNPGVPRPEPRGMVNPGYSAEVDETSADAKDADANPDDASSRADMYTETNDGPVDFANLKIGDPISPHEIPALGKALGFPGVKHSDLTKSAPVRYWVHDKTGRKFPQLGGLMLRPVIMLSDVMASGHGIVSNALVFRGDGRGPKQGYPRSNAPVWSNDHPGILERGFFGYEKDVDLYIHMLGHNNTNVDFSERTSGFVSTTPQIAVAAKFAGTTGWIYQMTVPAAIDMSAAMAEFSIYKDENEYSVPYNIAPEQFNTFRDVSTGIGQAGVSVKKFNKQMAALLRLQKKYAADDSDDGKQKLLTIEQQLKIIFSSDVNEEAYLAATGGGGGGAQGVDYELASRAKDFQTLAALYANGNVKEKTSILEEAGLFDVLQKKIASANVADVTTSFEQKALPKLVTQYGDTEVLDKGVPKKSFWQKILDIIHAASS